MVAVLWWPSADPAAPGAMGVAPTTNQEIGDQEIAEQSPSKAGEKPFAPSVRQVVRAADGAWDVRGTVKRGDHEPFPGARVKLELFAGYNTEGDLLDSVTVRAADNGSFVWRLTPPDTMVTLRAKHAEPQAHGYGDTRTVVAGRAAPQDLNVHIYPLDHRLEGQVVDGAGEPIDGAYVVHRTGSPPLVCDAEGRFGIDVSTAYQVSLRVGAPGYAVHSRRLDLATTGSSEITITLQPGLAIRGRVVDQQGAPIGGAEVRTLSTIYFAPVLTNQQGEFALAWLKPGRGSHSLFARKDGYVEASQKIHTEKDVADVELVLRRGVRLEGRVAGADGAPVPGAELYIGFSLLAYSRLDAVADADAAYAFPAVAPGSHTMVASAPGHAPTTRMIELAAVPAVQSIDVQLGAGHFAAGRTVDSAGESLASVGVSARSKGDYIGGRTTTDANGRFRLMDLPDDAGLEFYGRGITRKNVEPWVLDTDDQEVVLEHSASLAATVLDDQTGEPLTHFKVLLLDGAGGMPASWMHQGVEFRDSAGVWKTDWACLPIGVEIRAMVLAAGYGDAIVKMTTAVDPDPAKIVFHMQPGNVVRGQVVSQTNGELIEGARVILFDDVQPFEILDGEKFHRHRTVTTGADGRFEMVDVRAGQESLAVRHPDWPPHADGPFTVGSGVAVHRTIFLPDFAVVRGTVLDASGQGVVGAEVVLRLLRMRPFCARELKVRTATDGSFEIARGALRGDYVAQVSGADGVPLLNAQVEIGIGDADLRLQLAGACTLTGEVRATGELPEQLSVMLKSVDENDRMLVVEGAPAFSYQMQAVNGRFRGGGLPPGRYRISCWYGFTHTGGGMSARQIVQVAVGKTAHVVLELRP